MAAEVVISLLLALLMGLTLSSTLQAQGPALTTISEVRYSDEGWGVGYNGNLIGRYTNSSFTLTRYARGQTYFLRSYDNSTPPKYSRYSTALQVDYPTS
jgi:broad specificity phosphatase PhoE